jgi:hypothetical protein
VYAGANKGTQGIQSDVLSSDLMSTYLDETKREVLVESTEDADAVNNAAHDLRVGGGRADSDVDNEENDDESFDDQDHNDDYESDRSNAWFT